jgi:hypothetical protein
MQAEALGLKAGLFDLIWEVGGENVSHLHGL